MSFRPIEMHVSNRRAQCTVAFRNNARYRRVYVSITGDALKRGGMSVGGRCAVLVGYGQDRGKIILAPPEMHPYEAHVKIKDVYEHEGKKCGPAGSRGQIALEPWFRRAAPIRAQAVSLAYPEGGGIEITLPAAFTEKPALEIA